jgi:ABC-type transporter Mla subunit MlaD
MSKFKEKLAELKSKVKDLDAISVDVNTTAEFKTFYNEYWPKIKDILVFVKDQKVTRRRADKKLQQAIDAGDDVFATLNDPEKLKAALDHFGEILDKIDNKLDKTISVLKFIDKFFKEETDFDNLLDNTVDFLTKVNNTLEELGEKIDAINGE